MLLWKKQQILLYLLGCLTFSLGAKFFVDSHLGTDPLDVLVIGIVDTLQLPFIKMGLVSAFIAICFLIVWSIWNKKWPPITPFITMASIGYLIDFWNYIQLELYTISFSSYLILAIGLILASYGSALIIMSGIGIRTMDLLAISMVHKWNWSFFYAKMLFEVSFIILGWLFGGPIGIGTILFLCVVGPGIIPIMKLNTKLFNLKNYGLQK